MGSNGRNAVSSRAQAPVFHRHLIAAAALSLFAAPAFAAPGDPQDCVEGTGGPNSLICGAPLAGNVASGVNAIAIGTNNSAAQDNAIAAGTDNTVNGIGAIGLGSGNNSVGAGTVAVGSNNDGRNAGVVMAGVSNVTNGTVDANKAGQNMTAVGGYNAVGGGGSGAFGVGNVASGVVPLNGAGTAYGRDAQGRLLNADGSVPISNNANQHYLIGAYNRTVSYNGVDYALAAGVKNRVNGVSSAAVGFENEIGTFTVVDNIVEGDQSGFMSTGSAANNSFAVGQSNTIRSASGTAVGTSNKLFGTSASAFGRNNTVGQFDVDDQGLVEARNAIALGNENAVSASAGTALGYKNAVSAVNGTAIGVQSSATGDGYAFAAGTFAQASGKYAVALGSSSLATGGPNASGSRAIAVGTTAVADEEDTVAIGAVSAAHGSKSVALGSGAQVTAAATGSVALGQGSVANVANTISVGRAGAERRIVNTAAGVGDTDAVNVSQLKGLTTALGGGAGINGTTGAVTGPTYNINGTKYTDVGAALTAAAASGGGGGGNLLVDGGNNTWSSNATAPVAGTTKNTVALGAGAVANESGNNSTAIGRGAQATGTGVGSIALGQNALAMGGGSVTRDIQNATTDSAGVTSAGNPFMKEGDTVKTETNTDRTAISIGNDAAVVAAGSVGIGNAALVTGPRSVAVGPYAAASGFRSTALGDHAFADGEQSIAIGSDSIDTGVVGARASGANSIAIGSDTSVTADRSIVFGLNAQSTEADSVALGANSVANRANVISVGKSGTGNQRQIIYVAAGVQDTDAVNVSQLKGVTAALGGSAGVSGTGAVTAPSYVIGGNTYKDVGSALVALEALGGGGGGGGGSNLLVDAGTGNTWSINATAGGANALALGQTAQAAVNGAIALGSGAQANENGSYNNPLPSGADHTSKEDSNSVAIGRNAQVTGTGHGSIALGQNALAIGDGVAPWDIRNATTDSAGVTSVGSPLLAAGEHNVRDSALASTTPTATAIGSNAAVLGGGSVGIGNDVIVTGSRSVAVGALSVASGSRSTAMGDHSFAEGAYSIAIGVDSADGDVTGAHASGENSIAIGADTKVSADRAVVLGVNAVSTAADSVALGANSLADRANAVSVGNAATQRQIVYVAKGTADTDAVNVSQLKGVTDLIGGGAKVDPATGAVSTQITVGGTAYNTLAEAIEAGVGGGSPLAVQYDDATKGSITLGGGTDGTTISNVADGVAATDAVNKGQLDDVADDLAALGDDALLWDATANAFSASHGGTVTNKITNVAAGDVNATSTDSVNGSQLHGVSTSVASGLGGGSTLNADGTISAPSYNVAGGTQNNVGAALTALDGSLTSLDDSAVQYDDPANKDSITLGDGAGGTTVIHNVADGVVDSDAVNKGQLDDVADDLAALGDDALKWDATVGAFSASHGAAATNKITNVAAGTVSNTSTDAVNGSQLHGVSTSVATGLGGGSVVNPDGSISAPSYSVAGGTQNNVGAALTALDGSIAAIGDSAVQYDDATAKDSITLQGTASTDGGVTGGTKISNLAQGAVADGSTDAVNGTQLYNTASGVAGVIGGGLGVDPATGEITGTPAFAVGGGDTKSTVADAFDAVGDKIDDLDTAVSGVLNDALLFDGTAYNAERGGAPTRITGVANGTVAAGSSDAVTGDQLHATNQNVAQNATDISALDGRVTANETDIGNLQGDVANLDGRVTNNETAIGDLQTDVAGNKAAIDGLDGRTTALEGSVAANTDAINDLGNRTTTLENDVADLDNRVTQNSDDISDLQGQVAGISDAAVQYDDPANKDTVTFGGADGTKLSNVAAGDVSATSSDAVNGAQLYETRQQVQAISDNMNGDAPTLGGGATAGGAQAVAIGAGATAGNANSVALGAGSTTDRDNTVSVGSAGHERQITNVAAGTADTDAVNVAQLNKVNASGVHYDTNSDGSINYSSVTFGDPSGLGGAVSLHNIAAGVEATDAVNVGQLNNLRNDLRHRMSRYRDEANAGVAAAIAMEAAPYVPGHITYAIGSGYYINQGAIGVTFRGTAENGRWSLTTGVSTSEEGTAVRVGVSGVLW